MMFEVQRTAEFSNWLKDLTDLAAKDAILARLVRIQSGLMGDVKSLGGKLSEFRVDLGQGYRLYSMRTGKTVIPARYGNEYPAKEGQIIMADELGITTFDAAEYLDSERAQLSLLNDAIESGNPAYIANAIGAVARARAGMSTLARATGIKRQTLNKSLSLKGNPTLETLVPVLTKLGLRMQIVAAPANDQGKAKDRARA